MHIRHSAAAFLVLSAMACRNTPPRLPPPAASTLRIGAGIVRGSSDINGLTNQVRALTQETLVTVARDGRPQPAIARDWSSSADRLTWTIHFQHGIRFHNGEPLTSQTLAEILTLKLPDTMGVAFQDVVSIRPVAEDAVQIALARPSNLFVEALDISVDTPERGGTSAYRREGDLAVRANDDYWGDRPALDRIVFTQYDSTRAAWADMLRGDLDMLYTVGVDAFDSLATAHDIRLFEFQRLYAYEIRLNIKRPGLADPEVRRRLNAAIDRRLLVEEGLGGHGRPEDSPLWPQHWAIPADLPRVIYQPTPLEEPLQLTCLVPDPSLERLALAVQRQLTAIGVELILERVSLDEWNRRVRNPSNYGSFSSRAVDSAIDAIHDSSDDDGYRRGVAALGRAIVDDPPAIFLAWAQSLRAVSTRFEPHHDPARDVMFTIPLWRVAPVAPPAVTH